MTEYTGDFFGTKPPGGRDQIIQALREENQRLRDSPNITTCVVCDQDCKVYTRQMYSTQARCLIALYQLGEDFQHIGPIYRQARYVGGDGALCKLVHWDLVVPGQERGCWGITDLGKRFVHNQVSVWKNIRLYNDEFLGFVYGERVMIADALGADFSYQELMSR